MHKLVLRRVRIISACLAIVCASVYPAAGQDITSNLRGHWKLTETSGVTAVDYSPPPAKNGTYTGGVLLANTSTPDGAVAANFDGVNDYVAVSSESYFDITGNITVSAWIKVDAWTVQWQSIVTKGDSAWRLVRDNLNNGVTFACTGLTTLRVSSTVAVNDGQWHHVVGVYNGSQLLIYIDGVLNNSVGSFGFTSQNNFPVEIGRNAETVNRWFDGAIYDARVYNRALNATDVMALFLQGEPVGHWKLNDGAGTTAVDSSYYARHGTVTGGAAWSTRCDGTGTFDFDAISHYISVPNATQLQPTSALTIAAWIRGDAWSAANDVDTILRKGDATPNNYALSIADGRAQLLLDDNDTVGIRGNTVLNTGQWYHVAATWDGATARVYVNGVLDMTPVARAGTIAADARALFIGGRTGATDFFDGMIQGVYLYNRALSQADIARLAGLPGQWKFSEGTGTTAADTSGVGNDATLVGGAGWTTDCAGNKALLTTGAGGIAQTAAVFNPPSEGTVSFWMQPTAGTTLRRIFGNGGDWEARQQADGTLAFDLCGEGGTSFVTTEPLNETGRWYHVAASFNAADDTYSVYVDGELHKTGVNTVNMVKQPSAILSFGTRTGAVDYWAGALRDFRVYSRRLCASEISELAGLAAWWKFDETSGAIAADSSGWGRSGAVTGTPMWTAGKTGNSLQLNGATYMSTSAAGITPKNVTLAAWANLTTADSGGAELISLGDYVSIRLNEAGQSRAFFYNGTTWTSVAINQTFAGLGWRHFAAVLDDDNNVFKLYINGAEVASLATTASISYSGLGSNIVIGRHGNGTTTLDFTGQVDDAHVYTRALCPTQVMELVNDGGGPYQGVRILQWVETR